MRTEVGRVREHTSPRANGKIDRQIRESVRDYEFRSAPEITRRIEELDREWDVERILEANASTLALAGLALGATHDRKWLMIPGLVLPFLLQHALHGWCPPLPVLRSLGVRTRREIDREKYALKALRGDFDDIRTPEAAVSATQ